MQDEQIIALYWQREPDAIRETQNKYGAYCLAVAKNILNSEQDSEECVSDTWLRAWNSIPPSRPKILKLFLAKITRRLSIDRCKALTAQKRGSGETAAVLDELSECISDSVNVEDAAITKELVQSINQFVENLAEKERKIFVRRYFFTDPMDAIAKRYGISQNNVQVILSRTRKKLKEHLQKEGYLE